MNLLMMLTRCGLPLVKMIFEITFFQCGPGVERLLQKTVAIRSISMTDCYLQMFVLRGTSLIGVDS